MQDLASLIGTPSRLTVRDDEGNIIVKEGEVITQGVINSAERAGRLDELRIAAAMSETKPGNIQEAPEYEEIGEEEPSGVHPESR